jgi:hypothetical protein
MGDLVVYLCKEELGAALGFEKELTFTNPISDLMKNFSEVMVNQLLRELIATLVLAGVAIGELVAIDSTFLQVFGKTYESAARGYSGHLGKTALGYKLHLLYDVQLRLPLAIWITPGNVSDASSIEVLRDRLVAAIGKRPNQTYVLDRGYFSPEELGKLARDGMFFVCRAKLWPKYITSFVDSLQDGDFRPVTRKFRIASTLVIEPTQGRLLLLVVIRHVSFPKPLALVTNAIDMRPAQVYALYRKRFYIEAAFQELRGKWHLNRFVGTDYSQVAAHVGMAVLGLALHRSFRQCLQQRTALAGIKAIRTKIYTAVQPEVPAGISSNQLSRLPLDRLQRELVKLLQAGATTVRAVLMHFLGTSFPKLKIQIAFCMEP